MGIGSIFTMANPNEERKGKLISFFPRQIANAIFLAALSGVITNGILKLFCCVIGVSTKPGLMMVIPIPDNPSSKRTLSRNRNKAALLAE